MGSSESEAGGRAKTKPLIQIVDDEPMLLDLAQAILSPAGYEVAGFRSGEAALRSFEAATVKPALLITDYAMGLDLMNGLELVKACRKICPSLKVLLLSGTVDESIYHNTDEKPDAFLGKPYLPPQLVQVVKKLIGT